MLGARVKPRLQALTELANVVQGRLPIDELLECVVQHTAEVMQVEHASVRLLDPSRRYLVAARRTGTLMAGQAVEFKRGEGLLGWIVEHGEGLCIVDPASDPRYVSRPGTPRLESFAGTPLFAASRAFGVLSAISEKRRMDEEDLMYMQLIAAICGPQLEIARLSHLTQVDPLTGSLNRRGFDRVYPDEIADGETPTMADPLTVIEVDIDHFKRVNDAHGHAVGDEVLRQVVRILGRAIRAGDEVVRLGGEEFLLVLPDVRLDRALAVAERARHEVEQSEIRVGGESIRVTISLGVAERQL